MKTRNLISKALALCCATTLFGCGNENAAPVEETPLAQQQSELDYSPGSGWNLAWSDEFDGSSLNTGNWTALTSNYDPVTGNCNFGTGELEYPRAQNVTVSGGKLVLTAERTGDNPVDSRCTGYGARSFYSGRIHSKGKVEKRYGKIVASIKVPSGYGMWPAFWTLGGNISSVGWPACGEVDILEWTSNEPSWMKSAVHWYTTGQADWGTGANRGYSLADAFHTYEVEWNSTSMVFRLDGSIVGTTFYSTESEFQQNHYIILNLALGGNWYGNPSASSIDLASGVKKTMEVEWVRWYQQGTTPPPSSSVTNPGFENGMTGWNTWSPNGTEAADFNETYNGGHGGSYHLTHWTNGTPHEVWTYQTVSGLASGNYKVRAWIRKGGAYDFSRIQAKTCASCNPVYTDLGTYGSWTLVETPAISVTGGYLEFGFHTKLSAGNSANFVHMDDVELIKL
ncbi:glycoside hydrolase family 16 protein [Hyalangium versicolor]|uniref:glycoside hydrolase family 16 protein n=1 Tax=Hyalangium versicolor TaxID=2861190 RepID=UPI001CCFE28B|nr:glycoside hydrolase family 16 protein [Hyalangium versicolor]